MFDSSAFRSLISSLLKALFESVEGCCALKVLPGRSVNAGGSCVLPSTFKSTSGALFRVMDFNCCSKLLGFIVL